MFEPENDLERALMAAANDASRRTEFIRQLLDGQVFTAMLLDGEAVPEGDGKFTIPVGAKLIQRLVARNGVEHFPFFTAPSRAWAVFTANHVAMPDKTRDLFARHPGVPFLLNPGSEYGRDFPPGEIERLLAGDLVGKPDFKTVTVTKKTDVRVGQPSPYPMQLVEALKEAFAAHAAVRSAYLAQIQYEGTPPHPMIGIENEGDWRAMMNGLQPGLKLAIGDGRLVDFTPYPTGQLADYFSRIEPFYRRAEPAAKKWRGWFSGRGG